MPGTLEDIWEKTKDVFGDLGTSAVGGLENTAKTLGTNSTNIILLYLLTDWIDKQSAKENIKPTEALSTVKGNTENIQNLLTGYTSGKVDNPELSLARYRMGNRVYDTPINPPAINPQLQVLAESEINPAYENSMYNYAMTEPVLANTPARNTTTSMATAGVSPYIKQAMDYYATNTAPTAVSPRGKQPVQTSGQNPLLRDTASTIAMRGTTNATPPALYNPYATNPDYGQPNQDLINLMLNKIQTPNQQNQWGSNLLQQNLSNRFGTREMMNNNVAGRLNPATMNNNVVNQTNAPTIPSSVQQAMIEQRNVTPNINYKEFSPIPITRQPITTTQPDANKYRTYDASLGSGLPDTVIQTMLSNLNRNNAPAISPSITQAQQQQATVTPNIPYTEFNPTNKNNINDVFNYLKSLLGMEQYLPQTNNGIMR